jgi:ubiquinone/menaquinone biosynthesis C-methylase UbiE
MSDHQSDLVIERDRYDRRADSILSTGNLKALGADGAAGIPEHLRAPYLAYEEQVRRRTKPGCVALDVCCGNGLHSLTSALAGAKGFVSDIAPNNVELTLRRATRAGLKLEGCIADAERLPWPDASFDLITCAGSLSYIDHATFFAEVFRLLRPGGSFVCVDSLNHNPVYRFNRYIHFKCGHRSLSTLKRMPRLATIDLMRQMIGPVQTSYFGVFAFLAPILNPFLGRGRCGRLIDTADYMLPSLHRFAFKFVAIAQK